MRRLRAFSLPLLITDLFWAYNFVSIKVLYAVGFSPASLGLGRYLLMAMALAGVCRLYREPLKPAERADWRPILWLGFLSMGLYMVLFLEGMQRTTPAEGAIVLATIPILTALMSAAFGMERLTLGAFLGASVAFAGVAMVALGGAAETHGSLLGNGLVLSSAFVWAFAATRMKPLLAKYSPVRLLTLSMPGAFPILLPYGLLPLLATPIGSMGAVGWLNIAQVVLGSGVIAFLGFYAGVRQVGPAGATLYQFLVPPLAAFFAFVLLGQTLAPMQWVGFAVVLAGVISASIARARTAQLAVPAEP